MICKIVETRTFVLISFLLVIVNVLQDYLHLPVIALAIPLHATIEVTPHELSKVNGRVLDLHVPQLNQFFRYDLDNLPPRQTSLENADFALAAIHEAIQDGWKIRHGASCVSTTDIVMQAGCSSSTAFTTAWILVLAKLAGVDLANDPMRLAQLAHRAEVLHFGAPGGTMDHVSIALGGSCLRIGPEMWKVEKLQNLGDDDGVWVLADSGDTKDTFGHLKRCKGDRLSLLQKLGGSWDVDISKGVLSSDEKLLLDATITNRNCENSAAELWRGKDQQKCGSVGKELGSLMLRHHGALRDGLKLSTPKLEAIGHAALEAGAWGFKLVGSGGGGCNVAWVPHELVDTVSAAMRRAGAKSTWTIDRPERGARVVEV